VVAVLIVLKLAAGLAFLMVGLAGLKYIKNNYPNQPRGR
jgi:hypothetical protein